MASRKASVLQPSIRSSSTFVRSSGELPETMEKFVQDTFQRHGSVEPNASSMIMYMSSQRYKKGIQTCTSSYMMTTHKVFPRNSALESQMKFSLGLIVEPLSTIGDTKVTLQQDTGLQLPRCSFCGAYINGYNRFTDTRTTVFCCICDELTRLPPAYSALLRNVSTIRPELSHEAYDYLCPAQTVGVGAEYTELINTSTGHACYYAIELTEHTIRTKKAIEVLTAILGHLDYLVEVHNRSNCPVYIGLLFFNTYVHVLARTSPNSQDLCIYSLIDRNTLPVPDGFLISISDLHSFNALYSFIKRTIHTLMLKQTLSFVPPTLTQVRQTELAHALELMAEVLKARGGRVIMFISTQPKNLVSGQYDGSGRTACQDNHFNMKSLFSCLSVFYGNMAIRLVRLKISVSTVLMPASSISGFGSVLELTRHTNGGLWYVEKFCPHAAEAPIQLFLQREFGETTCFDVYCLIHLPKQLSIKYVLGTVMHRSDVAIYLAAATQASCCGVRLQVHGEIDRDITYYQSHTSFVTFSGQRVIRVCTKPLRLSSNIIRIITSVNSHVLVNMYAKLIAQTLRWSPHISNTQELILNKHTDLFIVYVSTLSETIDSVTAGKVLRRNLRDYLALYHNTLPDVVCYQRSNTFKLDLVDGLRFLDYWPELQVLPELIFFILKTDMLDPNPPQSESMIKSLVSMITLEGITTADIITYLCPSLYYIDVTTTEPIDDKGIQLPLLSSSLERPGVYLLESFYCLYVFINITPTNPLYSKLVFSKHYEQHTTTQPIVVPSNNTTKDDEQLKAPEPMRLSSPTPTKQNYDEIDDIFMTMAEQNKVISAIESNHLPVASLKRSSFFAKPLASTRSHSTIREKLSAGYKGIKEFIRSPSLALNNPKDDPRHPYTSAQMPFPRSLSVQPSVANKQQMDRERRNKNRHLHETLYLRADSEIATRVSAIIDVIQKRVYETRGVQLNIIVVSSQGAYARIIADYMTLSDTSRGISIDAFKQSIRNYILKSYDLLEK
ncbi:Sec24 [Giardia lamblia P15]|uniref:Sec24 n=1 Tax=Giardia intestinalis (strain P15) TaxID=658858 RepID=E1F6H0_GIAIA|nr:Sec24 [Giardia lamblia P15]